MKKAEVLDCYSYPVFEDMNVVESNMDLCIPYIKNTVEKETFVQLFCRGSSGLTIATVLMRKMKENGYNNTRIAYVRKNSESQHGSSSYPMSNYKIIVVDDFMSTGETLNHIFEHVEMNNSIDNIIGLICRESSNHYKIKELNNLKLLIL